MKKLRAIFCMTRAARALEIACDSREQKLYRLNRPLGVAAKRLGVQGPVVQSQIKLILG